jgi:hypothetical protein
MTSTPISLQEQLQLHLKNKLKLKINDNRSTMLSVRWEPDYTQVSLHRIFLNAPQNVMDALACYIHKKDKAVAPTVRAFIEDNWKNLDYSSQVDTKKLYTQGHVYNLKDIYNALNQEYFDGRLNLFITWFGKKNSQNKSQITFGLYYDPLKLIKINRLLDNRSFPDYVVSFIVYHEMLHHVSPSYYDEKGHHKIHSKEFKALEKRFQYFKQAQKWIKENQEHLFTRYF